MKTITTLTMKDGTERVYETCPAEVCEELLAALRDAALSLEAISNLIRAYPRPSLDPNGRMLVDAREHAAARARVVREAIAKATQP